ncbi:MAG: hypothetical protein E7Z80_04955 [Methanobrevibacter thaueri]|nr:hypothetical protein [Methanobrevibacter thaueri]
MNFKKNIILIISLVLIFAILLSAVSANTNTSNVQITNEKDISIINEDNNGVKTINQNNNDSELSFNDKEIMSNEHIFDGETFSQLQEEINNASSGDSIKLNKNIIQNGLSQIYINKTLTIDGNGHTINADGKSRIFSINADNVVLNNISFINGNSLNDNSKWTYDRIHILENCGGAIFWNGVNGTIKNCNFINNTVNCTNITGITHGGAIFLNNTKNAFLFNCTFKDNIAAHEVSQGGAIYAIGCENSNILNSTFINNTAGVDGGAIEITIYSNNFTIKNSKFNSNRGFGEVQGWGGAIDIDCRDCLIYNCTFENNEIGYNTFKDWKTNGAGGGAIYIGARKAIIDKCIFLNNSAFNCGGAINSQGSDATIKNCFFKNNFLRTDGPHGGGNGGYAINLGGYSDKGTVLNCTFTDNYGVIGGAIRSCSNQPCTIKNCNFTNNTEYEVYLEKSVYFENNTVSNLIWGASKILSKFNIIVLNNSTVYAIKNTPANITAIVVDDYNKIISVDNLYFTLPNGTKLTAKYDSNKKIYWANYTFTTIEDYLITANLTSTSSNIEIFDGILAIREKSELNITTTPIIYGEIATFTINITKEARGEIILSIGDNKYTIILNDTVNGLFDYNVSGLNPNNYLVKANYQGDSTYAPITVNTTLIVYKKPTSADDINITNSGNFTVGNATLIVNVPKNLTGNITVTINGKNYTAPIINGTARVNLNNVTGGVHNAKVTYSGNEINSPVDKNITITINKIDLDLQVNIVKGNDTTPTVIDITVPNDFDGIVTVKINDNVQTVPITTGKGSVSFNLGYNNYTAYINAVNSTKYNDYNITKDISIIDSRIPLNPETLINITNGSEIDLNLPKDANGTVYVYIDSIIYKNITVINGTSDHISLTNMTPGDHVIVIQYSGDNKYQPANKTFNVTVSNPVITLKSENLTVLYSGELLYNVQVLSDGKNITDGTNITITYNNNVFTVKTLNGYATILLQSELKPGIYKVTANYTNITIDNSIEIKNIINAKKLKKLKKSKKVNKVKVSLAKVNGKYLKGKKLTLKLKGKKVATAKTNKKGVATFKVKKKKLKKFKKGKKVKATVSFGNDVVTKKVKIV